MFFLNSRTKTLGTVLVGVAAFGITAAAVTAVSAQAAPAAPAVATASPSASASASPRSVPELAIGAVATIASGRDIALPVDTYKASPASQNLVLKAEYSAMKSCMARYGVDFGAPAGSWTVPAINHDYDRLFGLINLAEAQQYGYHTGEQLLATGEAAPSSTAAADPNESAPNYLAVATGDPAVPNVKGLAVPKGGCITEARSKLGDTSTAEALYENAVNYGLSQSDADSRVIAAFGSWSACMKNAGYSYANPMAAINDPQWGTTTPSQAEVKVATADVQCKTATNLTGLRVSVAAAWQKQYIGAHAAQYAAMKTDVGQQVSKANAILQ